MFNILENNKHKIIKSENYNLLFNKQTGYTARFGKTEDDDPQYCPFGPEILDIEISDVVDDKSESTEYLLITDGGCSGAKFCGNMCYKHNVGKYTRHMSLKAIKKILDVLPQYDGKHILQQVALGICSADSHPELFKICSEFRNRGICPNITTNGIGFDDKLAKKYVENFHAIAVSVNTYNKEYAYNTVNLLIKYGCEQTNVHYVLGNKSFDTGEIFGIIDDVVNDPRLSQLNALVLLAFKDKANTGVDTPITDATKYKKILDYAAKCGVRLGLDSCSGPKYLQAIRNDSDYKQKSECVETCCAGRFSAYINVFGFYFPCSFLENVNSWKTGISVLGCNYFYKEIWNSDRVLEWRKYTIECGEQRCPCNYFKN